MLRQQTNQRPTLRSRSWRRRSSGACVDFAGSDVRALLESKGATRLYHANTVTTALSMMEAGGLVSRGYAVGNGFSQTAQDSDEKDKRFGVWNDVFVDPVDIHARAGKRNIYGPVLFVLDLELLEWPKLGTVRITRDNPLNWRANQKATDRYFSTLAEFYIRYSLGDFHVMFTVRGGTQPVPFRRFLRCVAVDDPKLTLHGGQNEFEVTRSRIEALLPSEWDVPVKGHDCRSDCRCFGEYASLGRKDMQQLFR